MLTDPYNVAPRYTGAFRCAGTRSFRLASGKFFDFGGNVQNPVKPLLQCLEARAGYSFLQPDQSGAEALIVAYLCRPGRYRALFRAGIKPHVFLALHIFRRAEWFIGLPLTSKEYLEELDPEKLARLPGWKELDKRIKNSDYDPARPYFCGKRVAHARAYKMGWFTFMINLLKDTHGELVIDAKEAKRLLAVYDELFPEVLEWQQEIINEVRENRVLCNLFGFPREFNRIFTDGYEREAISFKPQSTVGCITHEAVIKVTRWPALNNKHDSALWEVRDEEIPEAAPIIGNAMKIELTGRDGVKFRMGSSLKIGKNWADALPDGTNPLGMKEYEFN